MDIMIENRYNALKEFTEYRWKDLEDTNKLNAPENKGLLFITGVVNYEWYLKNVVAEEPPHVKN